MRLLLDFLASFIDFRSMKSVSRFVENFSKRSKSQSISSTKFWWSLYILNFEAGHRSPRLLAWAFRPLSTWCFFDISKPLNILRWDDSSHSWSAKWMTPTISNVENRILYINLSTFLFLTDFSITTFEKIIDRNIIREFWLPKIMQIQASKLNYRKETEINRFLLNKLIEVSSILTWKAYDSSVPLFYRPEKWFNVEG